jgi:deoxyadenosine/deoxycytidine kinase
MTISEAKEVFRLSNILFKTREYSVPAQIFFVGSRLWSQCKDGQQQNTGGLLCEFSDKVRRVKVKAP